VEPDWIEVDESDAGTLTGEAVALALHPTGFALRAGGALIDFAAELIVYLLVVAGASYGLAQTDAEGAVWASVAILAFVLCFVIAPAVVETVTKGKSLGRLAVGARIVRDDGGAIGFRHAIVRSLVGVFEFYLTFGGGAALIGLLSPRTQRLGDLLAGTYSQYERVSGKVMPLFGMPPELYGWARVADVARLPDPLARRVSQFLANAAQFDPPRRWAIASELAAEVSVFVSPVPAVAPEFFLAGVTVLRREREAEALRLEAERLRKLQPALTAIPHRPTPAG
jgi:uncharacterized RDD family membrane protein YckC